MALKVELKPNEKIIIGDCVIANSNQRTQLSIFGKSPILREKDILTFKTANSPAKRIYLVIQLMYLQEDVEKLREDYFDLVRDFLNAAPSSLSIIDKINNEILTGSLYKALKIASKLVSYEQELIARAKSGS